MLSIDASQFQDRIGRYINDAKAKKNCVCRVMEINGSIKLCFFALKEIALKTELRYDYGDNNLYWRKEVYYYAYNIFIFAIVFVLVLLHIFL